MKDYADPNEFVLEERVCAVCGKHFYAPKGRVWGFDSAGKAICSAQCYAEASKQSQRDDNDD